MYYLIYIVTMHSQRVNRKTSTSKASDDDGPVGKDTMLNFQQGEYSYSLSKNLDVSLWIEYRAYYGNFPLQEVFEGHFVIVNEHLHNTFDKFKKRLYPYINSPIQLVN